MTVRRVQAACEISSPFFLNHLAQAANRSFSSRRLCLNSIKEFNGITYPGEVILKVTLVFTYTSPNPTKKGLELFISPECLREGNVTFQQMRSFR